MEKIFNVPRYIFMSENFKLVLLNQCIADVEQKIEEVFKGINQAQESIESDTKSSAGDKFETSREMIQQDLNRYHEQLDKAKRDLSILQRLDVNSISDTVQLGSLVRTDMASYFIAVSLGRTLIEDKSVMVISSFSPIGRLLLGASVNALINFNGKDQVVLEII
ncbi:hypothetical protein ORI89_07930 [Sphingobacterium sp. UT-1RO-CII-1]|uniref:hypothetical protein n=1 Tax=Sphingobacterium sp. UT-1RO-CII-1 TaxID=2995225 RepID=UPI00227A1702|nr:hypothetical protein [Sphingobacterium sp. UT-1RO-CII-1]MCY4779576.1 hypothetical protein [Sphingobacterium sp. UT-1RO-CII-1]